MNASSLVLRELAFPSCYVVCIECKKAVEDACM